MYATHAVFLRSICAVEQPQAVAGKTTVLEELFGSNNGNGQTMFQVWALLQTEQAVVGLRENCSDRGRRVCVYKQEANGKCEIWFCCTNGSAVNHFYISNQL